MIYNKGNITADTAILEDIYPIADNMCHGDMLECSAFGSTPVEMLTYSFQNSIDAYTIKLKGKPISMFGIVKHDLMSRSAMMWILSSEDIYKMGVRLVMGSKKILDMWLQEYDEVYNFIHADNDKAIKWAKILGAKLTDVKIGEYNQDFVKFSFFKKTTSLMKVLTSNSNLAPRDRIQMFEEALLKCDDVIVSGDDREPPLIHDFADGMYTRTIKMPKGMVLTGKIHKHGHPSFLLQGKVEVYTEHDGLQILEAPLVMMSKPGTKRVLYMLEDTIWSTVHVNPTNTRDIKELENLIIAKSYDDVEYIQEVAV